MSKLAYHIGHYKMGQIGALSGHNWQHREEYSTHANPDIDPGRSPDNIKLLLPVNGSLYLAAKARIAEGCTGRVTAASNWITETITYPPEGLDDRTELERYFRDVLSWHQENFGLDNVLAAVVHLDETTPHMHLDLVPLTADHRLSTKAIFTRASLTKQHSDLAKYLSQRGWEIERGDQTDGRKAVTVKEYKRGKEQELRELEKQIEDLNGQKAAVQEAAEQAAQEAADARQETKSALRVAKVVKEKVKELQAAVEPPAALQSITPGRSVTGKVTLTKGEYDTLTRTATAASVAAQDAQQARAMADAAARNRRELENRVKELTARNAEMKNELEWMKYLVKYLKEFFMEIWQRIVAPLWMIWPQILTFREAAAADPQKRDTALQADNLLRKTAAWLDQKAVYKDCLVASGVSEDQAKEIVDEHFSQQVPGWQSGWDTEWDR